MPSLTLQIDQTAAPALLALLNDMQAISRAKSAGRGAGMPTREQLQQAIAKLGFDPESDPLSDTEIPAADRESIRMCRSRLTARYSRAEVHKHLSDEADPRSLPDEISRVAVGVAERRGIEFMTALDLVRRYAAR